MELSRLSHAYIAPGNPAEVLAIAAVCPERDGVKPCMDCPHCGKASRHIHPDITVVDKLPNRKEIVVEQIRELKKDVIVVPNESDKKAYIINDADLMNNSAQNALLQILEEPPRHVVFILNTDNPAALLPTVRSRCVEINARLESEIPDSVAGEIADDFFSALDNGNTRLIALMFRLEKLDKPVFADFLTSARRISSARLKSYSPSSSCASHETLARAERILFRAGEMLDLNVGVGHISGMICASLMEIEKRI